MTAEKYLASEHEADEKHELFDGSIIERPRSSFTHVLIVSNVIRVLGQQLKGSQFSEFTSDLRVSLAERAFCYPDISVARPPFEVIPGLTDTLINPTVLIEVVSPCTRATDRNRKVPIYREIPSLMGYLLVEEECISVEYGFRSPGSAWEV